MKNILIRKMVRKDTDAVLALMKDLALWHDQLAYVKIEKDTFICQAFGEQPVIHACVAELEGKLIGYISYTRNFSIWAGSTYFAIDDVFVKDSFRSTGVGKRMMGFMRDEAKKAGINMIRWEAETTNEQAIQFYESLGAAHRSKQIFNWNI